MSGSALDGSDYVLMCRVLANWLDDRPGTCGDRLLDNHLGGFQLVQSALLRQSGLHGSGKFDLSSQVGWLAGRSLGRTKDEPILPIANFYYDASGGLVEKFGLRVALVRLRPDTTIHADGWRFELAEKPTDLKAKPLHPYQHAQAIIGWTTQSRCLLHAADAHDLDCAGIDKSTSEVINSERADARDGINQSHPAFPLATRTLTGLCVSALATLYGAEFTERIVDDDKLRRTKHLAVREDLEQRLTLEIAD